MPKYTKMKGFGVLINEGLTNSRNLVGLYKYKIIKAKLMFARF